MKTVFTSSGWTLARWSAAWMAVAPSRGAGTAASDPRNAPIGVRAAPTITTFFPWDGMAHSSRGGRRRFITRTWLSSRSAHTGHGKHRTRRRLARGTGLLVAHPARD